MNFFTRKTRIDNATILRAETQDFIRIKEHRLFIAKFECPNCKTLKLKLILHKQVKGDWETQILCDGCQATGVMNKDGIEFNLSGIPRKEAK